MSKIEVDQVDPQSGTTLTLGTSGDTVSIPSGVTLDTSNSTVTLPDGSVTNDMISYPLAKSGATVSTFNRTTSDGDILELQKDGTEVGSIGTNSGELTIGNKSAGLYFWGDSDRILPFNTTTQNITDNTLVLGREVTRFKDLYLGGGIFIGGTGTANKLDDYEEGTFTPTIIGNTSAGTGTYSSQLGKYTKIGNAVTVVGFLSWSAHTGSGYMKMGGLPFTTISTYPSAYALSEIGNITTSANNILLLQNQTSNTTAVFGKTPVGGGGDATVELDVAGYFRFTTTYFV